MESPTVDDGQVLRAHLFDGELLQLPRPEGSLDDFLPEWFEGPLPALIYPSLVERGVTPGENVNVEINPYHLYYGALRELAETADEERSEALRRITVHWNANAHLELCELGRQHLSEDVEIALLHFELAMDLSDSCYEAVHDAGMCEYVLSGIEGEDRDERLANADELFRRAIELRPDAGLSWVSLAQVMNDRGDTDDAQECLAQFLEQQPDGEHRELVEAALQGDLTTEADATDPVHQAAFVEAQGLAWGENPARAVELLAPMAEAYPDSPQVWFVLGAAHRRAGNLDEAERCLRRTVLRAAEEPFAWWELAQTYLGQRLWKQAEQAARKALELDPENPAYLLNLGQALIGLDDREAAREVLEEANSLVPDDPEISKALEQAGGSPAR